MSRLMASVYNLLMAHAEQRCLRSWRNELFSTISGDVLEVGGGTGLSLSCYPDTVQSLTMAEPDPAMRRKLLKAVQHASFKTEVIATTAEATQLSSRRFDAVVFSLVLCSVQDPLQALNEAHRILKPSGRLYFLEHVAAPAGSTSLRWQKRIEPFWRRLAGNCHLTRQTEQAIVDSGFSIESIQYQTLHPAPFFVRPSIRGIACKV